MTIAKGLAGTGAGFLVALLTGILKDEFRVRVPAVLFIGCLAGAIGAVLLAWLINASTRRFTWDPNS